MNNRNLFQKKVRIDGALVFDTAFHIGSGKEGELATNMGVLIEPDGRPILPGSTLKGCFRATAEKLAVYLGLSACLLDSAISGSTCYTGLPQKEQKKISDGFKKKNEAERIQWLEDEKNLCDICRLFGSPLQSSRIFFSDGRLTHWSNSLQIRNGVCIDRDSETARPGALYDYEVVPAGAAFDVSIELKNPSEKELAIVAAVLAEWEEEFRIGGFTSRGLGRAKFKDTIVQMVDYADANQLRSYLLDHEMQTANNLLPKCLEQILNPPGGHHAKKND